MITGTVSGRHALIRLQMLDPQRQGIELEFILDTGFAGFLTLPLSVVAGLALPFLYPMPARMADGTRTILPVPTGVVLWEGQERDAEILATGGDALLGTSLLDGHEVTIQFADGGLVTIDVL